MSTMVITTEAGAERHQVVAFGQQVHRRLHLGKVRLRIARFGYQDWDTDRANAELVANAPEWLDDLLGEVGLLRTLKHRHEQTITELAARAEAAEATVQLVRGMAESWATQPTDYDEDTEQQIEDGRAILRALDGGEQHG